MPSYRITIEAASLSELTGAVTEAASLLQSGDARQAMVSDVAQLAEQLTSQPDQPPWPAEASINAPLPLPPPDYQAAGLTEHQVMQVRQAQSQPPPPAQQQMAAAMAQMHPMTQAQAPTAPVMYAPPTTIVGAQQEAATVPFCPIHQKQMMWKGGGLSKNGKELPLWSCPDRSCREAIWPAR